MGLYRVTYKCPLCGRLLIAGAPKQIPDDKLPETLGAVIRNQLMAGNLYLYQAPMQIPCKCPDGSAGMAYFAGFKKVQ